MNVDLRPALVVLLLFFVGCTGALSRTDGRPEIIRAAGRGDLAAVKRLLGDTPTSLHATDDNGNTAAHWAILEGHNDIAIYLVENGFPITPPSKSEFPLVMA